jgi:hypothetical protein
LREAVAGGRFREDLLARIHLWTFALPALAAQQIASVSAGSFYLTLVPKDYQPTPLPALDVNAPLPGETANQLTPYGPEGRPES